MRKQKTVSALILLLFLLSPLWALNKQEKEILRLAQKIQQSAPLFQEIDWSNQQSYQSLRKIPHYYATMISLATQDYANDLLLGVLHQIPAQPKVLFHTILESKDKAKREVALYIVIRKELTSLSNPSNYQEIARLNLKKSQQGESFNWQNVYPPPIWHDFQQKQQLLKTFIKICAQETVASYIVCDLIQVLALRQVSELYPILINKVAHGKNISVRIAAVTALSNYPQESFVSTLLREMEKISLQIQRRQERLLKNWQNYQMRVELQGEVAKNKMLLAALLGALIEKDPNNKQLIANLLSSYWLEETLLLVPQKEFSSPSDKQQIVAFLKKAGYSFNNNTKLISNSQQWLLLTDESPPYFRGQKWQDKWLISTANPGLQSPLVLRLTQLEDHQIFRDDFLLQTKKIVVDYLVKQPQQDSLYQQMQQVAKKLYRVRGEKSRAFWLEKWQDQ